MEATDYFETVTDAGFARDAAVVLGGYLAPTLLAGPVEGMARNNLPVPNVPDEAHGILVVVGAEAVLSGDEKVLVQYGGGVYTLEKLLERFGVKDALNGLTGAN